MNMFRILHVTFYLHCFSYIMSCHLCLIMLLLLYVAGPHAKQPLADEISWVNMFLKKQKIVTTYSHKSAVMKYE